MTHKKSNIEESNIEQSKYDDYFFTNVVLPLA